MTTKPAVVPNEGHHGSALMAPARRLVTVRPCPATGWER
jgi:hypothetical protein